MSFAWRLCCLCLVSSSAWADVYLGVSQDGSPHYSTAPIQPGDELILRNPPDARPAAANTAQTGKASSEAARARRAHYQPLVLKLAQKHGLSPVLVDAIVTTESDYNPQARSRMGAIGLMQLMPATARQFGVNNPYDPAENLGAGMRYLKSLLALYDNNIVLALAAYNAGQGNVQKYANGIPPFSETMQYVPQVLARYKLPADLATQ